MIKAEAKRIADEAEAKRIAEEAEAKRIAEDAKAKRIAEEAEAKRIAVEAEVKRIVDGAKAEAEAEANKIVDGAKAEATKILASAKIQATKRNDEMLEFGWRDATEAVRKVITEKMFKDMETPLPSQPKMNPSQEAYLGTLCSLYAAQHEVDVMASREWMKPQLYNALRDLWKQANFITQTYYEEDEGTQWRFLKSKAYDVMHKAEEMKKTLSL